MRLQLKNNMRCMAKSGGRIGVDKKIHRHTTIEETPTTFVHHLPTSIHAKININNRSTSLCDDIIDIHTKYHVLRCSFFNSFCIFEYVQGQRVTPYLANLSALSF